MAGGPSVPALTIAAAEAGALSFLAGGYKKPAAMQVEIEAVRVGTDRAFGVNVFVPGQPTEDAEALAAYLGSLEAEAAVLGSEVGAGAWDDDSYDEKVALLLADPPPIVSFSFGSGFGCPSADVVEGLRARGALVAITVTTPDEAALVQDAGADYLCLQGSEAGAHRGSFVNDDRPGQDHLLPALLAAGAVAVQAGTAFLRCTESGANPTYRSALADPRFTATAITRAFSGRRARSLDNRFMREHEGAPKAYPEVNNATRALRAAAAAVGDPDHMSLYAGVNFRRAEVASAGEIIERLAAGVPEGWRQGGGCG
jgi:nitronate monooxygenase